MGIIAVVITIILYLITAIDQYIKKDYPHSLIWFCYACANIGFLWHMIIQEQTVK